MTTLYYRPKTSGRPMRVAWLLEEIGADYEAVPVPDTGSAEHHGRSPLGRVPVLEFDDGSRLFDSTAILLAIGDRHPGSRVLAAPGTRERDLTYQWCLTAQTELEKAGLGYLYTRDDDSRSLFGAVTAALGDALEGREFLVGDSIGVADIVTVGVLFLGEHSRLVSQEAPPRVQEYFARLGGRPALARAAQRTESVFQPAELLAG
jgi:glutathione S-transferase